MFHDLSHLIQNGMMVYPGDPQPEIHPAAAAAPPWKVSELHLGTHTGTHIDAASHFVPGGKSIDQYPVDRFILPGLIIPVLNLAEDQPLPVETIAGVLPRLPNGGAAVFHTGWDSFWGSERYLRHPYLSPEAARLLVEAGISLVGIDALNIDSTQQGNADAHHILLGNDVLIVENLTGLSRLDAQKAYRFFFLPMLLKESDGSPVRAVAWGA